MKNTLVYWILILVTWGLSQKEGSSFFPDFKPILPKMSALDGQVNPIVQVALSEDLISQKLSLVGEFNCSLIRSKTEILGLDSVPNEMMFKLCDKNVCVSGENIEEQAQRIRCVATDASFMYEKRKYRQGFEIFVNKQKKLTLLNLINVENYLKGVLPHEMGPSGLEHLEALKAQAVAARTYAYKYLKSHSARGFDLYADTRDQMYLGANSENALFNQAVEETQNLVLTYENDFIFAYYFSTAAGYTGDVQKLWQRENLPYLRGGPDLDSNGRAWSFRSNYSSWKRTFSKTKLIQAVKNNRKAAKVSLPHFDFTDILAIQIASRDESGRVGALEITTDRGVIVAKGDYARFLLRDPLYPERILPSSMFDIEEFGDSLVLVGKGLGHGIGMCQMGARERSFMGQSFDQILQAYYPGTQLVDLSKRQENRSE